MTRLLRSPIVAARRFAPLSSKGFRHSALVVFEIAISLTLLVSAGLPLRSFMNLQQVTGGFSIPPRQILTMLISPGSRKYNDPRAGIAFYDEVLRRTRGMPEWKRLPLPTRFRPIARARLTALRLKGILWRREN